MATLDADGTVKFAKDNSFSFAYNCVDAHIRTCSSLYTKKSDQGAKVEIFSGLVHLVSI